MSDFSMLQQHNFYLFTAFDMPYTHTFINAHTHTCMSPSDCLKIVKAASIIDLLKNYMRINKWIFAIFPFGSQSFALYSTCYLQVLK